MSDEPVHMLEENCEEMSMVFGELKLVVSILHVRVLLYHWRLCTVYSTPLDTHSLSLSLHNEATVHVYINFPICIISFPRAIMLGPLSPPIDTGNLAGSLANFIEQVTPKDFFALRVLCVTSDLLKLMLLFRMHGYW